MKVHILFYIDGEYGHRDFCGVFDSLKSLEDAVVVFEKKRQEVSEKRGIGYFPVENIFEETLAVDYGYCYGYCVREINSTDDLIQRAVGGR